MYLEVLNFWFDSSNRKNWFIKSEDFDNNVRERFLDIHTKAVAGELSSWRENIKGRLAEIIILDQFSRNIYRNKKESFEYDVVALVLSQEALKCDLSELTTEEKVFLYLPFMHSESREIHKTALELFSEKGMELNYDFELQHKEIIDRFGRYPHRNKILGRKSTEEELDFLKTHKGF